MINTKDRVADAAASARPYVERALRDKELRDNVRNAYTSARAVYDELASAPQGLGRRVAPRRPTRTSQDELRNAIDELRNGGRPRQGREAGAPDARCAPRGTACCWCSES